MTALISSSWTTIKKLLGQQRRGNDQKDPRDFTDRPEKDPVTQLSTGKELEERLHGHLLAANTGVHHYTYVLCMIDIDNLKHYNDKFGYSGANLLIQFLGHLIREFCSSRGSLCEGFKATKDGKGDKFAVLIECKDKDLANGFPQRQMELLLARIRLLLNISVSIGMAKMIIGDTSDKWQDRADKILRIAKQDYTGKNTVYSDLKGDILSENKEKDAENAAFDGTGNADDEKVAVVELWGELGTLADFHIDTREVALNEDNNLATKWALAIIDIDNLHDFEIANGNKRAKNEIYKVINCIVTLINLYHNGKYVIKGYHLSGGDELALLMTDYDDYRPLKNDDYGPSNNKSFVRYVLGALLQLVRCMCDTTISIGYERLNNEIREMSDEWQDKVNKYINIAKSKGKDRMYFGTNFEEELLKLEDIKRNQSLEEQKKEDDKITYNSIEEIEAKVELQFKQMSRERSLVIGGDGGKYDIMLRDVGLKNDYLRGIRDSLLSGLKIENDINFEAEIPFDRLYKEIYQFVEDNAGLRYGKQLIAMKNSGNKFGKHGISREHRMEIVIELCENAGKGKGFNVDNELKSLYSRLIWTDETIIANSRQYKVNKETYFINIYSFLVYQKEFIQELLINAEYYRRSGNKHDKEIYDFLLLCKTYLRKVCRLLIILYSCSEFEFIAVFSEFFKHVLGTNVFSLIFGVNGNGNGGSNGGSNEDVYEPLANVAINAAKAGKELDLQELARVSKRIVANNVCIGSFLRKLSDIYGGDSGNNGDNGNSVDIVETKAPEHALSDNNDGARGNGGDRNPIQYCLVVEACLQQLVYDIKHERERQRIMIADEESKQSINQINKFTHSKYNIKNLELSLSEIVQLKQLFNYDTDVDDLYYAYYNSKDLKALISDKRPEVPAGIIDIIVAYYSFDQWGWSKINKSNEITVVDSNDKLINYAIYDCPDNPISEIDLICFNDWIVTECDKKIYKHIFKAQAWFVDICLLLPQYVENANFTSVENEHWPGKNKNGNSLRISGRGAHAYYKNDKIEGIQKIEFEKWDAYDFFMFEVNLITQTTKFMFRLKKNSDGNSNGSLYEESIVRIPDEFMKKIQNAGKFQIAFMFVDSSRQAGIVKI